MNLSNLLTTLFVFITLFSTLESKKSKPKPKVTPVTFFTTKELDSTHLVRAILVSSGVVFTEIRFKKDSESMTKLFNEISDLGYLPPSLPMITDASKNARYISTHEAILSYLTISYNRELLSKNIASYVVSIQLSSTIRNYMDRIIPILNTSRKSLACSTVLSFENIKHVLKVLNTTFNSSKSKFLTGENLSVSDLVTYTLILFIENISPGCAIYSYEGLKELAMNVSSLPQMHKFETSSYFLSLLVPGTHAFAKRINFSHASPLFASLSS